MTYLQLKIRIMHYRNLSKVYENVFSDIYLYLLNLLAY